MRIWYSVEGADWLSGLWITVAGLDCALSLASGKTGGGPEVVGEVGVRFDSPSDKVSMFTSISE